MQTVRLQFPPVASPGFVAEAVLSAAFLSLHGAEMGDPVAVEANRLLSVAARAIRAGYRDVVLRAPFAAFARAARDCRGRATELYDGCPATPVLLTIALGCEAAAMGKAA